MVDILVVGDTMYEHLDSTWIAKISISKRETLGSPCFIYQNPWISKRETLGPRHPTPGRFFR